MSVQSIIPVIADRTISQEVQLVDAKALHRFLEIDARFNDWIARRIAEYGFQEGEDFYSALSKSTGGRRSREYRITLDMGKELAMVERNEKGKQARRYFIECEKRLAQIAPRDAATIMNQTIGTDGLHMLGAIVKGKVASLPAPVQRRATAKIWSQVHAAFGVRSAADIPAEHLDGARNFIASYAVLEGEFLGKEKSNGLSMSLQDWVEACPVTRHAQAGQPVGRVILTGALCADMDTVKPLQRLINQLAKQGVDVSAYEAHYHFLLEYLRENRRFLRDAQRLMEKASENEFAFRTRVAA